MIGTGVPIQMTLQLFLTVSGGLSHMHSGFDLFCLTWLGGL